MEKSIGEQVAQAIDKKLEEVISDGGYGKVTIEVTVRHSKPEFLIEKTQTKPVK